MRLDRFLAENGFGTRKEVKELLHKNNVTVGGVRVSDPGYQIDLQTDEVMVNEKPLHFEQFEYYMLNKPRGIVSAARVKTLKRGEKIPEGCEQLVVDLIHSSTRNDLFPMGRLDKDTEGLVIVCNDGKLSFRLLSPKFHVEKTYYAELDGPLTDEMKEMLEDGVDIGDETPTGKCRVEVLTDKSCLITITEGRYHQIKRMFHAVGTEVVFLKRIAFGPLELDEKLDPGQYRPLTKEEIDLLQKAAGLG